MGDFILKHISLLLVTCYFLLFLGGCIPKNIIDKVTLVQMIVVDKVQNNLHMTFIAPVKEKGKKVLLYDGRAHTMEQAEHYANLQARRPLVNGQLRVVLFTENMAKKGLSSYIDAFIRIPSIGNLIQLVILEGNVQSFLKYPYHFHENVPTFIYKLLEHNMENGMLPQMNLNTCSFKLHQEGNEMFLPIVALKDGKIRLTSLALFRGSKMVGRLKPAHFFVLKSLLEKHKLDLHTFSYHSQYIVVQNLTSTPQYNIQLKQGKPTFFISIKMKGRIEETTGHTKISPQYIKKIEHQIEKELNHQGQKLIRQFQTTRIDPLGLGSKYKMQYRSFQFKKWKDAYPFINIKVSFHVTLSNTGSIE